MKELLQYREILQKKLYAIRDKINLGRGAYNISKMQTSPQHVQHGMMMLTRVQPKSLIGDTSHTEIMECL